MSYFAKQIDEEIVRLLKASGIGLLPADTIYGLSCVALNEAAVKKLHLLKQRDKNKPFIVLISKISQIEGMGLISTDIGRALKYWPGKLTVVCESRNAPEWLSLGADSVAVRQPADEDLRSLIDKTGPIISTSANLAGTKPSVSAKQAVQYFGEKLDFYVDDGPRRGAPSTLVKPIATKLKIIRQGAVKIRKEDLYL